MGEAFQFHYSIDEQQRLVNLVFCEKMSLKLLQRWPYTIILDATYKTNKFNMYLVDIVGTTGAGKTFIIAPAFLSAEGKEDYSFILLWLKDVYTNTGLELPLSITTDRALGLLAALEAVFPTSYHLLCTVHINRDVLTYAKVHWRDELLANVGGERFSIDSIHELPQDSTTTTDTGLITAKEREQYMTLQEERFLKLWNALINATIITGEQGYEKAWRNLRLAYLGDYPQIVSYLEKTWLEPHKKAFCKAWTNLVRHFGNTTSNRAEASHRGVKKKIPARRLHLRQVIDIMQAYLQVTNQDHLKGVEQDRTSVGKFFLRPVLHEVKHRISTYAIRKMEEHLAFFDEQHSSALPRCKGTFSRIWGVPCAHTVYARIEAVERLKVDDFHPQWHLRRSEDFPPIDPMLLLRDPVVVRDKQTKGAKTNKTGRIWSTFEVVDRDIAIITDLRRPPGQKTPPQSPC
jgi:hypothetical protein